MCDEYVYNNNSYDIMDKCLYEKHKELNELLYENNKEMSDDAITQVELLNNKMVNNEINECSNHNNIKKVNNINTYDNININNIFTDIKKIIDDNCFLGNTIIESNMDCNFHMNIINKKNKKKDRSKELNRFIYQ